MSISDDLVSEPAHDMAGLAFILVADDDDSFRERLVQALRMKGFNVIQERSGDDAVKLCRTAKPSGVVMDYRFAGGELNGIQAMKAIRKIHPNHGGLNGIIVTENASEPAVCNQGDQVLSKSETEESIVEQIAESCLEGIKRQVAEVTKERFGTTFDRPDSWQNVLGDPETFVEVGRYRGTVTDVEVPDFPGAARICLSRIDGVDFYRIIPRTRLEAIGAAFETAEIEYRLHLGGSASLSKLYYVGPAREELLRQPIIDLSDKEIEELDSNEWRNS